MNKLKKSYIILLLIFLLTVVIIAVIINNRRYNELIFLSKAYSIKTTVTTAEMEKEGYIDVSYVHQKENREITKFLQRAGRNKRAIIKTYQVQDGEMIAKIYFYNPKMGLITSYIFQPWIQSTNGEETYLANYSTLEQDEVINIVLTNVKSPELSADAEVRLKDEILYSYIP